MPRPRSCTRRTRPAETWPSTRSAPADRPATTSVVFGARRRPEDATEIRLPEWEGPLGLLLALVEARRLDVLSVPLGDLSEAYLDALATLEGERLGNISAFVGVASQLILLKSRAMLPRSASADVPPSDDGPDPEAELRARLLLYRAFRDAGAALQGRALAGAFLARREPAVASAAGRRAGRRAGTCRGWMSGSWWPPSTGWHRSSRPRCRPRRSCHGRSRSPSGPVSSGLRSRTRARSCSRSCSRASGTGSWQR